MRKRERERTYIFQSLLKHWLNIRNMSRRHFIHVVSEEPDINDLRSRHKRAKTFHSTLFLKPEPAVPVFHLKFPGAE